MPHKAALIGSCLASFIATALGAQTVPVDDFRIWARTHAHPITISAKIIGNARVVAFGEPIHGAHEPLAARNRLIRYLVTQQGFTAVALETALSTSKRLYDYVLGNISQFIESLVRPHVINKNLEAAYKQMAEDEEREAEAFDWAEATVGDVSNETR